MSIWEDSKEPDMITGINVTPLVDITLVLLIIFMVTATLVLAPALKVELPHASNRMESPASPLSITLTADGRLYLNGNRVTENLLTDKLNNLTRTNHNLTAVIAADKNVTHGQFIRLIDLLELHGVAKFAIQVETQP